MRAPGLPRGQGAAGLVGFFGLTPDERESGGFRLG